MSKKAKKRLEDTKVVLHVGDVVTLLSTTTHDTISPYMTVEEVGEFAANVLWFSSDDQLQSAEFQLDLLTKIVTNR